MSKLNVGAYKSIMGQGMRASTVVGGTFARLFLSMTTLGFLSMYSQSGYSYALAGVGIAIVQASNCFIAPQVSRMIDKHGQSKVVPIAAAIGMVALASVLLTVHLNGPLPLAFVLSAFIGFTPQAQSLTRARWSYLLRRSGRYDPSKLKTAFSFEGALDDVSFMIAPALTIALSSWLFPEAGLLVGGITYVAGIVIVLLDRNSEPDVAYLQKHSSASTQRTRKQRSVLLAYPVALVLFAAMFMDGVTFGFIDPSTYDICRQLATEEVASLAFLFSGIVSALTGFVFGMVYLRASIVKQVIGAGLFFGICYFFMVTVTNIPLLFAAHIIGSFSYAPFVITLNTAVERAVEPSRVTEALTWVGAGLQLGLAVGPILGGAIVDTMGTHAGFIGTGIAALLIPITLFVCLPILRRGLPAD